MDFYEVLDDVLELLRCRGRLAVYETFGSHLWAKREECQERETALACELLNRMRQLGRPQSYPVR